MHLSSSPTLSYSVSACIEARAQSPTPVRRIIIAAEPVTDIDVTSGDILAELERTLTESGTELRFAEVMGSVKDKLKRYEMFERFGAAKLLSNRGKRPWTRTSTSTRSTGSLENERDVAIRECRYGQPRKTPGTIPGRSAPRSTTLLEATTTAQEPNEASRGKDRLHQRRDGCAGEGQLSIQGRARSRKIHRSSSSQAISLGDRRRVALDNHQPVVDGVPEETPCERLRDNGANSSRLDHRHRNLHRGATPEVRPADENVVRP
jgi:hypothetical protein